MGALDDVKIPVSTKKASISLGLILAIGGLFYGAWEMVGRPVPVMKTHLDDRITDVSVMLDSTNLRIERSACLARVEMARDIIYQIKMDVRRETRAMSQRNAKMATLDNEDP